MHGDDALMQIKSKAFKRIFFLAKILLAMLLLFWVLSKAHWNDYVKTSKKNNHKSYVVIKKDNLSNASISTVKVQEGMLWWARSLEISKSDIDPVDKTGKLIRKGVLSCVETINIPMFIGAFVCYLIALIVTGARFTVLLKAQNIFIKFGKIIRLSFLGQFYNSVIPGTVGGDLVKAYYINKHTRKTAEVLMSVFIDRLAGLINFSLVAALTLTIAILFGLAPLSQLKLAIVSATIAICLSGSIMLLILSPKFRKILRLERIYSKTSIAHHFAAAGNSTKIYREKPAVLAKVFGFTILNQFFVIGSCALLGLALNLQVPFWSYYLYIPLIFIIGAVPVTPGGVGIVENLYVKFFTLAAVGTVAPDVSLIIAFAMLARLVPIVLGIPGMWVVATGLKIPNTDAIQAELDISEMNEEYEKSHLQSDSEES